MSTEFDERERGVSFLGQFLIGLGFVFFLASFAFPNPIYILLAVVFVVLGWSNG